MDVMLSGIVTFVRLLHLLKADLLMHFTDETALNADVTGDGDADASDLTKMAQYVGKIISSLD
ncbi:MAG: hypothetical protein LUG15_02700 [Oscillospiraceae bacterium]|nr:hypothetical protein [Oscillospiraceae bacterium]